MFSLEDKVKELEMRILKLEQVIEKIQHPVFIARFNSGDATMKWEEEDDRHQKDPK